MPKPFLIAAMAVAVSAAVSIATIPALAATPRLKVAKPMKVLRVPARPVLRTQLPTPAAVEEVTETAPGTASSADGAAAVAEPVLGEPASGAVETASSEAAAGEVVAETPAPAAEVTPVASTTAEEPAQDPAKQSKNCRRNAAAKGMLALLLGESDLKDAARRQLDACR